MGKPPRRTPPPTRLDARARSLDLVARTLSALRAKENPAARTAPVTRPAATTRPRRT